MSVCLNPERNSENETFVENNPIAKKPKEEAYSDQFVAKSTKIDQSKVKVIEDTSKN